MLEQFNVARRPSMFSGKAGADDQDVDMEGAIVPYDPSEDEDFTYPPSEDDMEIEDEDQFEIPQFDGTLNEDLTRAIVPYQPPGGSGGGGGGRKRPGGDLDDYYEGHHPPPNPGPPRAGEKRPRDEDQLLLQLPDAMHEALQPFTGVVDLFNPPDPKRLRGYQWNRGNQYENPLADPTLSAPTNPVPTIPEDPMEGEGSPFWLHVLLGLPVLLNNYLN